MAEGKDKPPAFAVGAEAKTTVRYDADLEKERLAFEKEKFERELELERLRLDREKEKLDLERLKLERSEGVENMEVLLRREELGEAKGKRQGGAR